MSKMYISPSIRTGQTAWLERDEHAELGKWSSLRAPEEGTPTTSTSDHRTIPRELKPPSVFPKHAKTNNEGGPFGSFQASGCHFGLSQAYHQSTVWLCKLLLWLIRRTRFKLKEVHFLCCTTATKSVVVSGCPKIWTFEGEIPAIADLNFLQRFDLPKTWAERLKWLRYYLTKKIQKACHWIVGLAAFALPSFQSQQLFRKENQSKHSDLIYGTHKKTTTTRLFSLGDGKGWTFSAYVKVCLVKQGRVTCGLFSGHFTFFGQMSSPSGCWILWCMIGGWSFQEL